MSGSSFNPKTARSKELLSFIFGMASLFVFRYLFIQIAAIVLGIWSIAEAKHDPLLPRWLPYAGIAMGVVSVVFFILMVNNMM